MEETRLFQVLHTLDPVYDARSRVLLLGSMPSPKSRETGFYYGNPQNRFWRVLAAVLSADVPLSVAEKRALCLSRGIALWDVLAACRIRGAADASIREAKANDIGWLLKKAPIAAVFTTGGAAQKFYQKLVLPQTGVEAIPLPSTSPANCRMSVDTLTAAYRQILPHLLPL